jgi:hypothetical protein
MAILAGDISRIGESIALKSIPDVPSFRLASVDGYGNLKTTIKRHHLKDSILKSRILRVTINGFSQFILNTLIPGVSGKTYDLCLVQGSSGGKQGNYVEFVRLQAQAARDFRIDGPWDDMQEIKLEPVK